MKSYDKIKILAQKLNSIIENNTNYNKFSSSHNVKIEYNERYGYHFELTKRFDVLKKHYKNDINEFKLEEIETTSIKKEIQLKFFSKYLKENTKSRYILNKDKIKSACRINFIDDMKILYNNNKTMFRSIIQKICLIDFINSGVLLKDKLNYIKPILKKTNNSTIDIKQMRHPIVERIINKEYKPHDISLGKKINGILLYGLNSSGKSTIMKAIGLNIILAQMGYYTSCKHMEFSPYENLFCRISSKR